MYIPGKYRNILKKQTINYTVPKIITKDHQELYGELIMDGKLFISSPINELQQLLKFSEAANAILWEGSKN